jgi:hypothetical protein
LQRRVANDLGTQKQSRPGSMQLPRRELWNTLLMREHDARARDIYLSHFLAQTIVAPPYKSLKKRSKLRWNVC